MTPTVILNNLRENGAFGSQTEPSISVLYNKMNYMKRRLKINESIYNTHDLRMKISELLEKPEDDDTPWVPYSKIEDTGNTEPRFTVIFGTNKTLERLNRSVQIHIDATYVFYLI